MIHARTIEHYSIILKAGRWAATIKALQVSGNPKFPDGIKLNCVLLDIKNNHVRLILDNHAPFGYHIHPHMPEDGAYRVKITVADHTEAIEFFFRHAERIIHES